ncbi:hypothetical protein J3F83DRAFT_734785 [Trichoderma novae-zelandiae]
MEDSMSSMEAEASRASLPSTLLCLGTYSFVLCHSKPPSGRLSQSPESSNACKVPYRASYCEPQVAFVGRLVDLCDHLWPQRHQSLIRTRVDAPVISKKQRDGCSSRGLLRAAFLVHMSTYYTPVICRHASIRNGLQVLLMMSHALVPAGSAPADGAVVSRTIATYSDSEPTFIGWTRAVSEALTHFIGLTGLPGRFSCVRVSPQGKTCNKTDRLLRCQRILLPHAVIRA